jgi:putative transposase
MLANSLKRRRPRLGDKWLMGEVFVRIRGKMHYLWRAVDQAGHVLDILLQSRRDTKAAKRFFRKVLKGSPYAPRVIVTNKMRSVRSCQVSALAEPLSAQSCRSVPPADTTTRTAHEALQAQRFLSTESPIHNHFQLRRHRLSASENRASRNAAFSVRRNVTGIAPAA